MTGEKDQLSPLDPSKTKDNADHAGLFPLLDLLKEPVPYLEPKNSNHSLNLNLLTAHPVMETKDAMEDLWTMLSNLLKNTESPLNQPTLTDLFLEAVNLKEETLKSLHTPMLNKEMLNNLLPLLLNNQFPSLLMPITSNSIAQESSLTVKLHLIMELLLLDTPLMPGSLKTHGENHGEKMDTSDLQEETLVDLPMLPVTLFSECEFFYLYSNN